jgi:hypothetical protein
MAGGGAAQVAVQKQRSFIHPSISTAEYARLPVPVASFHGAKAGPQPFLHRDDTLKVLTYPRETVRGGKADAAALPIPRPRAHHI